jgi:4-amino-4-deoxy-L-arabinose transferase-like glycosyltransferase
MLKSGLLCFVVVVAGAVAFVSLGSKTLDDHEAFVSVTAREMIARDEYVIPTFNGQYRLNKTPLPYWLVVAAGRLTGRIDEFTARLPAAAMSVLSVICMLYFISVLLDIRTAFLASLVWACSLGYIRYSHSARPEMALTLFMLISFLSFFAAIEEPNRKKQICYSLIFWSSLGISVLAKAPSSIFFMVLSVLTYAAVFRRWRRLSKILPVWGMLLFLAIVLPWPIAAAHAMHWDLALWKQESVGRFTGDSRGGNHVGLYYIGRMVILMLPWAAVLPYAIGSPFFKVWRDKRRIMGYLWIAFFSGVLFLTLCTGKRQHYMLPLMPLMAILVGIIMEDMIFGRKVFGRRESANFLNWHLFILLFAGLAAAALAVQPIYEEAGRLVRWAVSTVADTNPDLPPYNGLLARFGLAIGIALALGPVLGAWFYARRRPATACVAVFAAVALVIVLGYSSLSVTHVDNNRTVADFARRVKEIIPPGDDLFLYGRVDSGFVHYFGRSLKTCAEPDVEALYNDGRWIFAYREDLRILKEAHDFKEAAVSWYRRGEELSEIAVFHKTGANE